ncbi:MAG: helix-turn-helix domain-containing protein [Patescibacteria group bacterium]|nr:helix-turn-helix domain-containing protein [Patescibacteria group bacterium]
MTRIIDRQKAIRLRKQGKTYSEIKKELKISKSTLSDWLSNFYLTNEQLKLLEKSIKRKKELAIEKYRGTMHSKRETRLEKIYDIQKRTILPLLKKELDIAGLFLYWGEGNKNLQGPVSINNTDPQVLLFTLYWLTKIIMVPKEKIKVYIHLYADMNIKKEINYWSTTLNISLSQFNKPYIKKSKRIDLDQKGFGHGTCALVVNNVRLKEKILMSIKVIADYYSRLNLCYN